VTFQGHPVSQPASPKLTGKKKEGDGKTKQKETARKKEVEEEEEGRLL
jgi:hypothetical protein